MNKDKWPARAVLPVAPPGLIFIFLSFLMTGGFFYLGWNILSWISLILTAFVCWFFRDPDRQIPNDKKNLISPADGKVIAVEKHLDGCPYLSGKYTKISIFMNVFNVHVNRIPFDGIIQKVQYSPGQFINASFDKASEYNERNALIVKTKDGAIYAVVQIAGLIARRIVNCVREGDSVKKGDRYGMIRFGSRIDLYLPYDFEVAVRIGDKTKAGETVIGYL
jgi:phosphatidylserine decarboxylase